MNAIHPGTSDATTFNGEEGLLSEVERLKKEKLLLEKQNKVMKKQASEIRENVQEMQEKYMTLESKAKKAAWNNQEHYTIPAFIDGIHGPSPLLKNAVKFYETHDGCPFHAIGCDQAANAECHGIWIRMGVPCENFAVKIKACMKSMNGLRK